MGEHGENTGTVPWWTFKNLGKIQDFRLRKQKYYYCPCSQAEQLIIKIQTILHARWLNYAQSIKGRFTTEPKLSSCTSFAVKPWGLVVHSHILTLHTCSHIRWMYNLSFKTINSLHHAPLVHYTGKTGLFPLPWSFGLWLMIALFFLEYSKLIVLSLLESCHNL